jgi:hypothetical protein
MVIIEHLFKANCSVALWIISVFIKSPFKQRKIFRKGLCVLMTFWLLKIEILNLIEIEIEPQSNQRY